MFKVFVKLNNGTEQLQKQNELYHIKLLNQDYKEANHNLKGELMKVLDQDKVNDILDHFTKDEMLMNMLSEDALNVLSKIQDLSPMLIKLLDHQRNLVDLFIVND